MKIETNDIVAREVYAPQTRLVERCFLDIFGTEDAVNLEDEEGNFKEVIQWWLVSDWLAEELSTRGLPVLSNEFGSWWGRVSNSCLTREIEAIFSS